MYVYNTSVGSVGMETYSSGYGGDGKFNELHSYAANVTLAMCGPKYSKNV